eukprot:TRINITY_DN4194_c0_g1_i2.p1 TRINITY_DN4194_c0_g1~~TRINITY_DN4194_c0_g1_i2.p1  ORF type:complete len:200 (-),score=7.76 TRINITY_DN4194_c0_g1_i2:691-1290(-)
MMTLLRVSSLHLHRQSIKSLRMMTTGMKCVAPFAPSPVQKHLDEFSSFMNDKSRLVVITGAGISTESGIPDYRSPGRPEYKPIQHETFVRHVESRQRYWARSMVGFRRMSQALPNVTHRVLSEWESRGLIDTLITQNVDHLHHFAGSQKVIELHGNIQQVECLSCKTHYSRKYIQGKLELLNPSWAEIALQITRESDRL